MFTRIRAIGIVLTLGIILSVASTPAQAGSCDRTKNVCVLTHGTLVLADTIRFTAPGHARPSFYAYQGQAEVDGWATLVSTSEADGYSVWQFVVRPTFKTGSARVVLSTDGCSRVCTGYNQNVEVPAAKLKTRARGSRGAFSFKAKRDLKATVTAKLLGKSTGGWHQIAKKTTSAKFMAGRHQLKAGSLPTHRCAQYSKCKLTVTGSIYTQAHPRHRWYRYWKVVSNTRRIK